MINRREIIKVGVFGSALTATSWGSYQLGKRSHPLPPPSAEPAPAQNAVVDPYPFDEEEKSDDRQPASVDINGRRIRKSIHTPEGQRDLETYAEAVALMRAAPPTRNSNGTIVPNGLNWEVQAQIHREHCPHDSWLFWPWHREYVFRFETIVRRITRNYEFSLPYWNWTASPGLPALFRDPTSPLYVDLTRRNSATTRDLIRTATSTTVVRPAVLNADLVSFIGDDETSGILEASAHNSVHRHIGGVMNSMGSPLDPIFWVHHCNVDRLWSDWQDRHPVNFNSPALREDYAEWLNATHGSFYNNLGLPRTVQVRTSQVLNPIAMNYQYDTSLRPQQPLAQVETDGGSAAASRGIASTSDSQPRRRRTGRMRKLAKDSVSEIEMDYGQSEDTLVVTCRLNESLLTQMRSFLTTHDDANDLLFRLRIMGLPILKGDLAAEISFSPMAKPQYPDDVYLLTSHSIFISPFENGGESHGDHGTHDHHGKKSNRPKDIAAPFFTNFNSALMNIKQLGLRRMDPKVAFVLEYKDLTTGKSVKIDKARFKSLNFEIETVEMS